MGFKRIVKGVVLLGAAAVANNIMENATRRGLEEIRGSGNEDDSRDYKSIFFWTFVAVSSFALAKRWGGRSRKLITNKD